MLIANVFGGTKHFCGMNFSFFFQFIFATLGWNFNLRIPRHRMSFFISFHYLKHRLLLLLLILHLLLLKLLCVFLTLLLVNLLLLRLVYLLLLVLHALHCVLFHTFFHWRFQFKLSLDLTQHIYQARLHCPLLDQGTFVSLVVRV